MHECPECFEVCYCDLDDSNDARDGADCAHPCGIDDDFALDDDLDENGEWTDEAILGDDAPPESSSNADRRS